MQRRLLSILIVSASTGFFGGYRENFKYEPNYVFSRLKNY